MGSDGLLVDRSGGEREARWDATEPGSANIW